MKFELNAIFEPQDDGWIVASIAELPEVLTQGKTIEEAKANLADALSLSFCTQRDSALPEVQTNHLFERFEFEISDLPRA
jgi:predicted RNase H-like HicB family nuclease